MEVLERVEAPAVAPVTSILDPRVEKGAALLDEKNPGWAEKIDVDTLEIGDYCGCVIGQAYGIGDVIDRYFVALEGLGVVDPGAWYGDPKGEEAAHGFFVPIHEEERITQDWRLAILARRTTSA